MTTTKIFLRNSDREIEYAADIVGDGRLLVQLPTGTALVHNANWGTVRIRVRPPYSKVFELREAEVRKLFAPGGGSARPLTAEAQRILTIIVGVNATPDHPLNMTRLASLAAVSSKRRLLELVNELTEAGKIRTQTLAERGRPRIIELEHS